MKKLSNLISLVFLLSAIVGYGQSTINWSINHNGESKVVAKQSTMNANWLIESLVIEMAFHDFSDNNNIKSAYLLQQSALKNNKPSKLFRSSNNSLVTLGLMEPVVARQFSVIEELKGTAPIHLMPEKYPQKVSVVSPKFSLPTGLGLDKRPKSFGPVLKF